MAELKSPTVGLGEKELGQVKKYMSVILDQGQFNASNITWEFYLIGNKFDSSKHIDREIKNMQHLGIPYVLYVCSLLDPASMRAIACPINKF